MSTIKFVLSQVNPTGAYGILHQGCAIGTKNARPLEFAPETPGRPVGLGEIFERNLLRQGDMRMVFEGFGEGEHAGVAGGVHAMQLRGARTELDIDHVSDGKDLDSG